MSTVGSSPADASAISIAGSPLSHVAMPKTPARVGNDRIRRRSTMAASLRNGSESSIPVVPWVRPSQGSVHAPAKGSASSAFSSRAASATSRPTSQCPVWKPSAMGVPSGARRPPWVLRIKTSGPPRRAGSHPMPAFIVSPNKLPEGWVRSISAVSGRDPAGPRACVTTPCKSRFGDSRTSLTAMVFING
jgi:hypothetical protein